MIEHDFILLQRLRRTFFAFKCAKLIDDELLFALLFDKHVQTLLRLVAHVGAYHCVFVHIVFIVFEDVKLLQLLPQLLVRLLLFFSSNNYAIIDLFIIVELVNSVGFPYFA